MPLKYSFGRNLGGKWKGNIFKQKKLLAADKEFISECAHVAEESIMKINLILTASVAQNKYQPPNDQNYV